MAGLAGVTALAWVYLLGMSAAMEDPDSMRQMGDTMTMARTTTWTTSDFFVMFVMWALMMVGMMGGITASTVSAVAGSSCACSSWEE